MFSFYVLLLCASITTGRALFNVTCEKMDFDNNVTAYNEFQASTISIQQYVGRQQCARACARHSACQSIAYNPSTLTCVLRTTAASTVTINEIKNYLGACRNHMCNVKQQCVQLTKGGYFCARLDTKVGAVVLVNGSVPSEGRVEIFYNGKWGKIYANDHWNSNAGTVVCRQLNYTFGTVVVDLPFGAGLNAFLVDDVICSGTENALGECSLKWRPPYFSDFYAAGVICSNTAFQEELSVPIRLTGGRTPSDGIVEMFYAGYWGTVVFDSNFDENEARVICRELNFTGETVTSSLLYDNYTHTVVWKYPRYCSGNEANFSSCNISIKFGEYSYVHGYDAAVICDDPAKSTINDTVRLANGDSSYKGRVEILHSSFWGTVCINGWDDLDALVVCRELGYSEGFAVFKNVFGKANSSLVTWLNNVRCNGSEQRLAECESDGWGIQSCRHTYDVGVICSGNYNGATPLGTLRLMNGISESDGRVEMNVFGEWSSVHHRYWDYKDAQVVCRQLGYTEGAPVFNAVPGSDKKYLEYMRCVGDELQLIDCPRTGFTGPISSAAEENAGVICTGNIDPVMEGQVRLMSGSNVQEGRVEVYHAGHWGAIWESSGNIPWKSENVQVVCQQLGYSAGRAVYGSFFGSTDLPVWMSGVQCNGDEARISECPFDGWGVQTLNAYYNFYQRGIGVVCGAYVGSYGDIRLVGGNSLSGRLEIYGPSGFGTVCEDNFNSNIARVACRQLGGYRYKNYSGYSKYGESTGIVWMQKVSCTGNELRLEYCSFRGWTYEPRCANNREFGITCQV